MKYHKIKNVDLSVCTAEAKIAYNLAQAYCDIIKKHYEIQDTQLNKSDVIVYSARGLTDSYKRQYSDTKYNIDAIFSCLMYGLEKYINSDYHILTSYKQIGDIFKSNYL